MCAAAKSQTGPVKKRSPSGTNNNKKKKRKGGGGGDSEDLSLSDVEIVDNLGAGGVGSSGSGSSSRSLGFHPTPLPKPPAGFVVDDHGKVLMASSKRIASIVRSFLLNFLPLSLFLLCVEFSVVKFKDSFCYSL